VETMPTFPEVSGSTPVDSNNLLPYNQQRDAMWHPSIHPTNGHVSTIGSSMSLPTKFPNNFPRHLSTSSIQSYDQLTSGMYRLHNQHFFAYLEKWRERDISAIWTLFEPVQVVLRS
jgi:hypothetical protein